MADAPALLTPWSNFYIMTGSSAGALTGLMFVVITLLNRDDRVNNVDRANKNDGIDTFSTPTVIHFTGALLVSAILIAPWGDLLHPAIVLAAAGLYGIWHILHVMRRVRKLRSYAPDIEDWFFYTILPLIAYAGITGGAFALPLAASTSLFAIGAGAVLLLFVGIRNSWDLVTFIVTGGMDDQVRAPGQAKSETTPKDG